MLQDSCLIILTDIPEVKKNRLNENVLIKYILKDIQ